MSHDTTTPTDRCLVVVPTYDEAENIDRLLDAVLRVAPFADVLVVDDNSPDGTAALVARRPEFGEHTLALRILIAREERG